MVSRLSHRDKFEKRKEKFFILNLKMTKNNLLFTIYKLNGELTYWINIKSSKLVGKGKIRYITKYSVIDLFDKVIYYLRNKKVWYTLKIRFFGLKVFRKMFKFLILRIVYRIRSTKIVSITYYNPVMHNGCFFRKKRR